MRRRIAVTGASGLLGTALLDSAAEDHEVFATSRTVGYQRPGVHWATLDLHDAGERTRWLQDVQPDALVYCAAIVNVDECERSESSALALHATIPGDIGRTVARWGTRLIYISTDSVFDGTTVTSYSEESPTRPLNSYARTKLAGENVISQIPGSTILRTNFFGWSRQDRASFAEWIIRGLINRERLGMFEDVFFTPIHVTQLARTIVRIIDSGISGLFHGAGADKLSKYEFAIQLASVFGLQSETIYARRLAEGNLAAARPGNMALSSERLARALALDPPTIREGLQLLKEQYDNGWVSEMKGRPTAGGYRFWHQS